MNVITDEIDFGAYLQNLPAEDMANVKPASAYRQQVKDRFYAQQGEAGVAMPWSKTVDRILLRPGKTSLWTGITHHGKTTLLKHVLLYAMAQGEKVCICSMEETPDESIEGMVMQAAGCDEPALSFIDAFHNWADEGRLWFYDQYGIVKADRLIAVLIYVAREFGVTQFVVDSLMKTDIRGDDYDGQREFVNRLQADGRRYGVHVHIVAHPRKVQDENKPVSIMDVAGSKDLVGQVDNVFQVWRNKAKENDPDAHADKPDAMLITEKQRGRRNWIGKTSLWFHRESKQYLESEHGRPMQFFNAAVYMNRNAQGVADGLVEF